MFHSGALIRDAHALDAIPGLQLAFPGSLKGSVTMGVQFYRAGEPLRLRVEILTLPPKRFVRMLGGPDDVLKMYLHMLERGSVPCMGDECEYCPFPTRLAAYAPVLEYIRGTGEVWTNRRAILPIYESCWDLATMDLRDTLLEVGKRGNKKTGEMEYVSKKKMPSIADLPFDVLARMMCRWGIRDYTRPAEMPDGTLKIAG